MSHEIIRSYNYDVLIPTTICFVLGLLYYYYKYRSTRNEIRNNDILRNNNSIPNNEEFIPNNINNNRDENSITIHVMIKGNRMQFNIMKDESISNFVNSRLIQHTEIPLDQRDRLKLIFQGRILDLNKKFEEYQNITSDSVIHSYIVNSSQSASQNREEDIRIENNNFNILDGNSVSVFTLLFHLSILILIILLLFAYKISSDLFSRGALLILKIMIVMWVIQVSKCLAKLAVYRKIVYH
jgi:hypothetical protein